MALNSLAKRFRIDDPDKFRLADCDPDERDGLEKQKAKALLDEGLGQLSELQERLYASDRWSVLIVLQAMDAAGKDSLIKHVMTGLNPQGVEVHPFKQPSAEELDHDFLWRAARRLPERGRIGIFNRSYYEEVLVVRVHPELLERQKLPAPLAGKDVWQQRFEDIRAFERHLVRSGTRILKFFLHVSKDEQRARFLERIDEPDNRWKFSMGDVEERKLWNKYMDAYEDMIRQTSRAEAPWFVVPADHKWFARIVVVAALVQEFEALKLEFPKVDGAALKALQEAAKVLKAEKG
jgi:PPK2 family polyphosphate:nucleotide phosphotransferase